MSNILSGDKEIEYRLRSSINPEKLFFTTPSSLNCGVNAPTRILDLKEI